MKVSRSGLMVGAIFFAGAARLEAGSIVYKGYEGGTFGTLVFEFTTAIPIPPGIPHEHPEIVIGDPYFLKILVPTYTFHIMGVSTTTLNPAPPTIDLFSTDSIHLEFASTTTIPTSPGTYDLVPGQFIYSGTTLIGVTGSRLQNGNFNKDAPEFTELVDTLVIATEIPEPSTMLLLAIGCAGMAVDTWRRRRLALQSGRT